MACSRRFWEHNWIRWELGSVVGVEVEEELRRGFWCVFLREKRWDFWKIWEKLSDLEERSLEN